MVTVHLLGGLGNNLFQIAAVHGISRRLGVPFAVRPEVDRGDCGPANKSTELEVAGVFADTSYVDPSLDTAGLRTIHQPDMGGRFEYHAPTEVDGTRYVGYFQSPRYFDRADADRLFAVRADLAADLQAKYSLGDGGNLSVHCRFAGDRAANPSTQHYHKNVSWEFYEQAVDMGLRSLEGMGRKTIWLFTDSPDASGIAGKLAVKFGTQVEVVAEDTPRSLALMTMMDSSVIGNSSFSWWGAYLGRRKGLVVAPRREWFGPGNAHLNTQDLFPPEWATL